MQNELFNKRNKMNGLALLSELADASTKTVFFDPQYRGVLDYLNYGDEGARQKGRCALPQMTEEDIMSFIWQINRAMVPSGHLFLWLDKFHLCEGVSDWFKKTDLKPVDLIVWDKGRIGMGYRSRRRSEYLCVLQKAPLKVRGAWQDHGIPDVWQEKVSRSGHPHNKPVELERRLILATTHAGDVVLDPAAGGYSVLEACVQAGRDFLGCDLVFGEEK